MHSILLILPPLIQTALPPPSSKVYLKNAIPRPEFSLCFSRNNECFVDKEGTEAGAMTLGGVDLRLHMSPMVFAKNMKSSGFYAVHLKAMYLREGGGRRYVLFFGEAQPSHPMLETRCYPWVRVIWH